VVRLVLERLCLLGCHLVAKVDQKSGKLIACVLAVAEAKRLALQRESDQQQHGGTGGDG
jgi:hypothetical protein